MALKGRSVNSMAKAWGIPQPTLDAYVKGKTIPDFDTALKMTKEAGADEKEAFEALAEKARSNRAAKFKLQSGFADLPMLALTLLGGTTASLLQTGFVQIDTPTLPMLGAALYTFYIMSNDGSDTVTIYIVYFNPVFESHHARYVH